MDKRTGLWAFALLALLILVMARATWSEHIHGSVRAYQTFYNSVWFTLLWVALATVGCYYIVIKALHKRLSVFLLHLSFVVILAGALVTRLTGKTGQIHLREGKAAVFFHDDATRYKIVMPFSLVLKSFDIEYYPGTNSPANYISIVEISDKESGEKFEREISMNNILRYRGFRFYQSSFDEDLHGSVLSVNHDAWGIMLSYAGYFLMFFSMLFVLFDRRERFRFLSRKLMQKTVPVLLFLGLSLSAGAQETHHSDRLAMSKQQAGQLGRLWVDYQGRICPVQTLAGEFTAKLTGKPRYGDLSGEQFFFGWLFFPEKWQHVPVFELKSKELKQMANMKSLACLTDFIDSNGQNKLEKYHRQMYGSGNPQGWLKEAVKLNDKFHLLEMLQHGSLLKIFPMQDEKGKLQWYPPSTMLPLQTDTMENVFARHFFALYYEALVNGNNAGMDMYAEKMSAFQHKKAGTLLPSNSRLKTELIYNRMNIFSLLFKICLTAGSLCLLFFIFGTVRNTTWPRMETVFYILLWAVFIIATVGLGLRTYIGGRLPVSNSYETMLLLSWLSLFTGILARRYSLLIMVFSFLLAGFTLLVAHIGSMNPQITPLVPVLKSPLLSIHVLTIMVSYGLCGFMALNSITSFAVWFFGGKKIDRIAYVERMKETSELFMFPATFLMGAGIFIGAIWANMSWGRYWGWDPKEVWALITFLLMAFTFHRRTLSWFGNPLFYHAFVIFVFLAVLMTYFGVNYILGGKHSYA